MVGKIIDLYCAIFKENIDCNCDCPINIRYDHLLAIERSGRAEDGNYYNMRGVNLKHLVDPIDDLFIAAKDIDGITTTGRFF